MSRLEILPGPGTVARFGEVCIWAAPGASAMLVRFLVDSARNVSDAPAGGRRVADHIGSVLARRDPEPGIGFATVGPSEQGTAVLLHGAIQAWDGHRWLVPQPQPGWLRTEIALQSAITVVTHGALGLSSAPASDLRRGVVPGAGFVLIPEPAAAPVPPTTTLVSSAFDATTTTAEPARTDTAKPVGHEPSSAHGVDPPGLVDLAAGRPTALAPLGPVGEAESSTPGKPVVAGIRCPDGHFNHPAVTRCIVCGQPVDPRRVSGTRPSLGVLLADNGDVYRLDSSYLIGSAPQTDPTVTGGRLRPLVLEEPPSVAAAHAEVRLTGWEVVVVGRGATSITQVLQPGDTTWSALPPFVTRSLKAGAHVAVGTRVLSLISPWPLDNPIN